MTIVSVILPTYNRCDSLIDSISSVLAQSYRDIELIVVDDASSEDVERAVRQFDDGRIRFIRRAVNGGAAAARNTGLAHAQGRFIAFQDSDDLWLPGKLEKQMALLATLPPSVGAVMGSKLLFKGGRPGSGFLPEVSIEPAPENALSLDGDQIGHLLWENRLSVQNALFRRECYPGSDWFDPHAKANEDWDFAVRLARGTKIVEHPEPVVLAFVSPDSISRNSRRQYIGAVRLLKKNRDLKSRYPRQFAYTEFYLGRLLAMTGKRRMGLRFMSAAILADPSLILSIVGGKLMRAFKRSGRRKAASSATREMNTAEPASMAAAQL